MAIPIAPRNGEELRKVKFLAVRNVLVPRCRIDMSALVSAACAIDNYPEDTPFVIKRMELMRLCHSDGRVLVITTDPRIPALLGELRDHYPLKLIGTLEQHEWMFEALDIILATPEQACLFTSCGQMSGSCLSGLLLDDEYNRADDKIHDVIAAYWLVLGSDGLAPRRCIENVDHLQIPQARMESAFTELVREYLPEAASCPGFGDSLFTTIPALKFAVFEEWSGVVACIPKLFKSSSLVLAPQHRIGQLGRLLTAFGRYMGVLPNLLGNPVVVATPAMVLEAMTALGATQLLIVDASNLKLHELEDVVELVPKLKSLCLHTPLVENISLGRYTFQSLKKAGTTLQHVLHHHEVSSSEASKVDALARIWQQMRAHRFVVFAEDPHKLGDELKQRGVKVCVTTTDMDAMALQATEREYLRCKRLLVTNRLVRTTMVVVNMFLPSSPQLYLERVGIDRNQGFKLAINIVTKAELQVLQDFLSFHDVPSSTMLPPVVRDLHKKFFNRFV